MKIIGRFRK